MSVTRVVLVVSSLLAVLGAAPRTASGQETTFIALGSDADEAVGHGSDTYFDASTADFIVDRMSGAHRDWISISIRPKDGSAWWSMGFRTPEHGLGRPLVGARHYATETPGYASAEINVSAAGAYCGRRIGSFIIRELRLALPAHVGFGVALEFDARCAGAAGGLYGQIRIYSTLTGSHVGRLGMSALSPVAPGTPLRFAVDTESSVPLQFKFIRYQVSTGAWTDIQDYSFRPIWSWTPTVGDLDDYYLQVWVRARGSTNSYDTWDSLGPFTISLSLASIVSLTSVSLTSDGSSSVAPGATITWTAAAHGGMLRLEYQFIKYSSARARWEIVRDWSPDPVWAQMTTPVDEGDNLVIVAVKSWGGDNLEAVQEAHVVVQPPAESYLLATGPPSEDLPRGQQVLFNSHTYGYVEAVAADDLDITASRALPDAYLSASMRGLDGGVPGVGLYENAEGRYADSVARIPALDLYLTTVSPCATRVTRKFRVFELEYDGGRTAARVAADIEQVCADATATIFVAVQNQLDIAPVQHVPGHVECAFHRRRWDLDHVDGGRVERHGARRIPLPALQRGGEPLDDRARLEHGPSIHLDAVHERLWGPSGPGLGPHPRKCCRLRGLAKFRAGRRHPHRATGVRTVLGCPTPQSRTAGHARGGRRWRIWSPRVSLHPVRVRDRSLVRDP